MIDLTRIRPSGYAFIEGLSGYGKTSLLARLVQLQPTFAYHFISQAYKGNNARFDCTDIEPLLLNLCEQLDATEPPARSTLDPHSRFHHLLRTSPAAGQRVVVIDAIDEVATSPNYLLGLLPQQVPPGVFVILSARRLGERSCLSEVGLRRPDLAFYCELPGLDAAAVGALLGQAGGCATQYVNEENFVHELHALSKGDPFYVRFLIEDVAAGLITPRNVDRVPTGINEYMDRQLAILDRSAHLPQHRDMLGLMLVAHGPLSRQDLIQMVEGLDWLNFNTVVQGIRRFLLERGDTFTFCHSRFKEYFAAQMGD